MAVISKRPGFAREPSGNAYVTQGDFSQRVRPDGMSQFNEVIVAPRTPIIELNSSYGTSVLRDVEATTGSASISSSSTGEILLSTGTTASSTAHLDSTEIGRYLPGYGSEIGVGVRIPTAPTGNQFVEWGGLSPDENDGILWGQDATGVYVSYVRGGTKTKVRPDSWNIDALDGNGPSGFNLDTSVGHIYQINYTWYGYGQIIFGLIAIQPDKENVGVVNGYKPYQTFIPCHSIKMENSTSLQSPNLKIHVEASNGGDTSDFDVYIGGRQYSVVGQYVPKFRYISDIRASTTVGTSIEPLITFRVKSAFYDRSVKLSGFEAINNGTDDVYLEVYLDGSLTGASYGTPTNATAAETAIESDISATAITGGTKIWGPTLLAAGTKKQGNESRIDLSFDIPDGSIVTLAATSLVGSNSVTSTLTAKEEW